MFETNSTMMITESMLSELRESLQGQMSQKRYRHTLAVEQMVQRLGELFVNEEQILRLRAAALLHDVTKEYSAEKQLKILLDFGINVSKQDILTPKTFHARTAALLIPTLYAEFADPALISAVRYHTTGRADMTLAEKLLYLADYIDESRTFPDCVRLREMFFGKDPQEMGEKERLSHLDRVLVASFDMTVAGLLADGAIISEDTVAARNFLLANL